MKAVVIYEPGSASMEQIMAVYSRHKVLVDAFASMMGPVSSWSLPETSVAGFRYRC